MKSRFLSRTILLFLLTLYLSACGNNDASASSGAGTSNNTPISQATIASTPTTNQVAPTPTLDQVTPTPTTDQIAPTPTPTPTLDQVTPTPTPTLDQVMPTPTPTLDQVTPTPQPTPTVDLAGATSRIDTFCQLLNSGALQQAYGLTSSAYQSQYNIDQFTSQFNNIDPTHGGCAYSSPTVSGNTVIVSLTINRINPSDGTTNSTNYTATLIQDPQSGSWVIDSIQ